MNNDDWNIVDNNGAEFQVNNETNSNFTELVTDMNNTIQNLQNDDNTKIADDKKEHTFEFTSLQRELDELTRSFIKNVDTRMGKETSTNKPKSRLILDSETDGCIQWNEKVSVQLPDSIKIALREDVLQHFEVNLQHKLKKRIVHDFLQELFNSDKWKDSELKKSFDLEYVRRKTAGGNKYGGTACIGPMYQLVMKSCGFPLYSPPSAPAGIAYYFVEKKD